MIATDLPAVVAAPLEQVRSVYESGKYLTGYHLAKSHGLLAPSDDVERSLLGARIIARNGGSRAARLTRLRTWRAHRQHPTACFWYAIEMDGALDTWEFLTKTGEFADATDEQRVDWLLIHAQTMAELRDFAEARRWWRQAKAIAETPWVWSVYAQICGAEDRIDDALEAANRCFELKPWYGPAVAFYGSTLRRARRIDEARSFLVEAGQHIESCHVAMQLHFLETEGERYAAALANLERLVELWPAMERDELTFCVSRFAYTAYLAGDVDRSVRVARNAGIPALEELADQLEANPSGRRVRLDVPSVPQHHNTCGPASLTSIAEYWQREVEHVELAEQICHDGTTAHSERSWALDNGWQVREFTVTWQAAVALIDAKLPFTLITTYVAAAHAQVVTGYDSRRRCLLIRDPSSLSITEYDWDKLAESEAAFGPRGMVMVPADGTGSDALDGIALPKTALYDLRFELEHALAKHNRAEAAAALERMRAADDSDDMLVLRCERALAHYDADHRGKLSWADAMLAAYPDDERLMLAKLTGMHGLVPPPEQLAFAEVATKGKHPAPELLAEHAYLLARTPAGSDRATRLLRRALRAAPTSPGVMSFLADQLWDAGERDKAASLYRFASCLSEGNEAAAWTYFLAARHIGETERALDHLRARVDKMGSRSPGPAQTLSDAYDALHRRGEALATLQQAVDVHADDGYVLAQISSYYLSIGDKTNARALLERAKGQCSETAWRRIAATLAEYEGDYDAALEHWRAVADAEPLAMDAQSQLANLLARTKNPAAAADHLRALCNEYPHHRGLAGLLQAYLWDVDDDEALEHLRQLTKTFANDADSHRALARNHGQIGDLEAAKASLERARAVDPNSDAMHLADAQMSELEGDIEGARRAYRLALRANIDNRTALESLDRLSTTPQQQRAFIDLCFEELTRQNSAGGAIMAFAETVAQVLERDEAERILRDLHSRRPDLPATFSARAHHHQSAGDYGQAIRLATQATELFPLLPAVWVDLATCHQADGDSDAQIAALGKALEINPNWSVALRGLGDAHDRRGDRERSLELLRRAVQVDPLDAANRGYLADLLWRMREPQQAIAELEQALNIDPAYKWAWDRLAEWSDSTDHAIRFARKLSETRHTHADVWLALAEMMSYAPVAQRLECVDEALKRQPLLLTAHDVRAQLLTSAKRYDEAIEACRPERWGDDRPMELRGREAWVRYCRGDRDDAVEQMLALIADVPDYAWAIHTIVGWASEAYDTFEGLELCEKIAQKAPRSATAWLVLAEARWEAGDPDAAGRAYQKALELEPKHRDALLGMSDIYFFQQQSDKALELLAQFPEDDPAAASRRARLYARAGSPDQVERAVDTVLSAPKGTVRGIEASIGGATQYQLGELARSLVVRHMKRDDAGAHVGYAYFKYIMSRWWPAAAWWRLPKLPASDATDLVVHEYIESYAQEGRKLALRVYTRLYRRFLRNSEAAWAAVGVALVHHGLWRKAVDWLSDFSRRKNVEPWMLTNLAYAAQMRKMFSAASDARRAALEMPADHQSYHHRLWLAAHEALEGSYSYAEELIAEAQPYCSSPSDLYTAAFTRVLIELRTSDAPPAHSYATMATALEEIGRRWPLRDRDEHAQVFRQYAIRQLRTERGGWAGWSWWWRVHSL